MTKTYHHALNLRNTVMHNKLKKCKHALTTSLLLILALNSSASIAADADIDQVRLETGVVRIVTIIKFSGGRFADKVINVSSGTGILLNTQGDIATNAHVAEPKEAVENKRKEVQKFAKKFAKEYPGKFAPINFLYSLYTDLGKPNLIQYQTYLLDGGLDKSRWRNTTLSWVSHKKDLAILRAKGLDSTRAPMILTETDQPRLAKGTKIWSSGYPGASDTGKFSIKKVFDETGFFYSAAAIETKLQTYALSPVRRDGVISEYSEENIGSEDTRTRVFDHTAAVNSGNSGGPLLDLCGRVIGINQSVPASTFIRGTFWSTRNTELIEELKKLKIAYQFDASICDPHEARVPSWQRISIGIGILLALAAMVLMLTIRHKCLRR
ncbi:MAG TPA: serine protease [Acidiferrobacteraceae bacterium]|nr:serine protease [Acidiferrobacteraceae bacterium]